MRSSHSERGIGFIAVLIDRIAVDERQQETISSEDERKRRQRGYRGQDERSKEMLMAKGRVETSSRGHSSG